MTVERPPAPGVEDDRDHGRDPRGGERSVGEEFGRSVRRDDGFVPIGSYAALGDGRTVALVAEDGSVDWWPVPRTDSPPAFAAVLDPERGGAVRLRPDGPFSVRRRYLPDTNVVETRFRTADGEVAVRDALVVGRSGRLPWLELVRRVEGVRGEVPMRWEVAPGDRFGTARPWVERRDDRIVVHVGDQHLGVRAHDVGEPESELTRVHGRFTASAGSTGLLVISGSDDAPVFVGERVEAQDHLDLTVRRWREWTSSISHDGPWAEAVRRSALALKLLVVTPTGAMVAAPTTSLPERVGGDQNWDYRYMWVRDTSFAADAFIALGLHEEVQAVVEWLLGAVRRTAPHLHVLYTLDGDPADGERTVDAPGYRGSRPVRTGNGATSQLQSGTFGDLFDTIWRYVRAGHLLDAQTGRMLADLADRCCDLWPRPDAGIWELHRNRHYTISKMGCWVALDRAVRLAEAGEIPDGHVARWRGEAEAIHAWVNRHCWSDEKRSYTFYAGTDELDAATLLAGRTGFDRGERLVGTIEAVRRELGRGPMVYRYSSAIGTEGCFVACTFWLVSALALVGRREEAHTLMDRAVAMANDVGLLAEEIDPETGASLGNVPQGLSHLALINAATVLDGHGPA